MGEPGSPNRVVLGHTYNTPIGLYSADNVNETIARTLKSINVSNYQVEEPKMLEKRMIDFLANLFFFSSSNEYKPTAVKSMPKPAPYTPSPQSYSEPYSTPSKPNG